MMIADETDKELDYSNVDAKTIKTIIPKRQGSAYTKFQKRRFDKVSLQSKLGLTTNEIDASGHQTYGNNKDKLKELQKLYKLVGSSTIILDKYESDSSFSSFAKSNLLSIATKFTIWSN